MANTAQHEQYCSHPQTGTRLSTDSTRQRGPSAACCAVAQKLVGQQACSVRLRKRGRLVAFSKYTPLLECEPGCSCPLKSCDTPPRGPALPDCVILIHCSSYELFVPPRYACRPYVRHICLLCSPFLGVQPRMTLHCCTRCDAAPLRDHDVCGENVRKLSTGAPANCAQPQRRLHPPQLRLQR